MGDDPTKPGKGYSLAFGAPQRYLPDYFEAATQITSIALVFGIASIKYSITGKAGTYISVSLPLAANITIQAGTTVWWQITYTTNASDGLAYIKYQ